jgi:predicted KAP-like P-loop ATPase
LILGEVNIIDFLVIEALRIFVPEVYHSIKRNKLIFTSVGDKEDSTEIKESFEKLISNSDEKIPRDAILGVCKELFPKVKRAYTNIGYSDEQLLLWRRELRVCSPEMFDRYFLLSVPEIDVSETEVQHILSKAAGFGEFIEQLLSLYGEGRLRSFLRKMIDRFEEIPEENIPKIVHALIDLGDRVEEDSSGLFDSGSHGDIDEVIRRLLRRVPSTLERAEIIRTAIEQTQGIYYPMRIVGFYEHEIKRYKEGFTLEEPSFDEGSINTLRGLCLEKVRKAAKSGMLQSTQKLGHILVYWQRWSESDDAKKYAMDLAETPRGAVTVLTGFLTRSWSFSFGDYVARQEWRIPLDTIAQFVDVEFLSRKIDELENDEYEKLSDKEKIAIESFRKQVRERNHREDA